MSRKFSDLNDQEQSIVSLLMDRLKTTKSANVEARFNLLDRFDLDVNDPVFLDFLINMSEFEQQPSSSSLKPVKVKKLVNKPNQKSMTYANSKDLIIIQNRLLHAISHLTLNERRLILFLSPIVRKKIENNPDNRVFYVRVQDFIAEYNIKSKNYYGELEKIADSIVKKAFFFWYKTQNGKAKKGVSWVSECDYLENEGQIKIKLDSTVIEMLTVFDKTTGNFWTQYQKEWIVNLGAYGIIMLEMILSSMESKGYYTVEHLREKFDCIDTYKKFSDFKCHVIDGAIKEIHKHTPIKIVYEQHKTGRKVTGLTFSYINTNLKEVANKTKSAKENSQQNDPFVNFKMTHKQMALFASKIKKAHGDSIDDIMAELSNVHLQSKHVGFLKVLDYVPSDWYTEEEIRSHLTAEQIKEAKMLKKIETDKIQEDQKTRLEEDYEKILQNAEVFVMANQHRIRRNTVEQFLFEAGDYLAIIKSWKNDLMDEKSRKNFNKIDEIL